MENLAAIQVVVGLIIGFILEYLIDLFWWRGKLRQSRGQNLNYEQMLKAQSDEMVFLREQITSLEGVVSSQEERTLTESEAVATKQWELDNLHVQLEAATARAHQFELESTKARESLRLERVAWQDERAKLQNASLLPSAPDKRAALQKQLKVWRQALRDAAAENKRLTASLQTAYQDMQRLRKEGVISEPEALIMAEKAREAGIELDDDIDSTRVRVLESALREAYDDQHSLRDQLAVTETELATRTFALQSAREEIGVLKSLLRGSGGYSAELPPVSEDETVVAGMSFDHIEMVEGV